MIHRDIKPANLWVESPSGRVKILDFGLARPSRDDTQMSGSGAVVGTPAFMAPEQARGEAVDHRADLFSLGVVLYRMTTGRLPFSGNNVMAVLTALAVETPPSVASLNPAVPPPLAGLIDQLLAKDPGNRPGSAADVAGELKRIEAALDFEELPRAVPVEFPALDPWRNIELTEPDSLSKSSVPMAVPVAEVPVSKPAIVRPLKKRPVSVKLTVLWGLMALLMVGTAVGMFIRMRPRPAPAPEETAAEDKDKPPPKTNPKKAPEPLPAVFVPPLDDGYSPLDNLDPAKIPAGERLDWQPKELVAVIGTHTMRHWGEIKFIAYSPKGDLVASCGKDGLVRLWDASSMVEKASFPTSWEHDGPHCHFSPDGRLLAVFPNEKNRSTLYDVTQNPPIRVVEFGIMHPRQPFSPDGKYLLAVNATPPHAYELWETSGQKPIKIDTGVNTKPGTFQSFLVGAKTILAISTREAGLTDVARLIDLGTTEGKVLAELEIDGPEAVVSPDGKWFVNSSLTVKKIRVYDISGGKFEENGSFEAGDANGRAYPLQFLPGSSEDLLSVDRSRLQGSIRNLKTGQTRSLKGQIPQFINFAIGPKAGRIVSSYHSSTRLTSHELKSDGEFAIGAQADPVISVRPSPAANRAMTWDAAPSSPRRWDLDGPEPKPLTIKQAVSDFGLTILPDGRVVGLDAARSLCFIDPNKGDAGVPIKLPGNFPTLHAVASSRSGRWLAAANSDAGAPKLFDLSVNPPRVVADLGVSPLPSYVESIVFSPGEQFVLIVRGETGATVWDLRGPKPKSIAELPMVTRVAFSPDTPTLVLGHNDGKVKLFDYSTGEFKETVAMQPFTRPVTGAILLPGAKTVMACDYQGHIKFLKVPTGEVEKEWHWPGWAVLSLSNDGRHVFTENANGTGYVLRLADAPKVGPSPLDALDRAAIPHTELVPELPPDAVAVIGSHAGKHWGGVDWITCTSNGKYLATSGKDGTVKLFDVAAGKELAALNSGLAFQVRVAVSSDGRTLAACSPSGAKVWGVEVGKTTLRHEFPGPALDLALSLDGQRLILTNSDADIRVIDISGVKSRVVLKSAVGHKGNVYLPVFIRGGSQFATSGADKTIRVWNASTGEKVFAFGPYDREAFLVSIRDGQALASADYDGMVRMWDLSGPEPKETSFRLNSAGPIHWAHIAADGSKLVRGVNQSVQLWNLPDPGGKPSAVIENISDSRMVLTADGKTLFASNAAIHSTEVVDLTASPPKRRPVVAGVGGHRPTAVTPAGQLFGRWATSGGEVMARYDLAGPAYGSPQPDARLDLAEPDQIWFSGAPKYSIVYTKLESNTLVQYDLSQPPGAPPARQVKTSYPIAYIHGSADGSTVAVFTKAGEEHTALVFRPKGGGFEEVARIEHLPLAAWKIRLSLDGRSLYLRDATGGFTGTLRKWDLSGPKPSEVKLPAKFTGVADWNLSADGRRLATSTGREATVWDVTGPDPRPVGKIEGFTLGGYWKVIPSPDGRQVVVGGMDLQNRYWLGLYDVATGSKRREWTFPSYLFNVQFAPDGRHLIFANGNGTGYVIRLQRGPPR